MSMIINTDTKSVESQSHRKYPDNWNGEGWLPVPPELEAEVQASAPYLDLIIKDGVITGVTPTECPEPEPSERDVQADLLAMAVDHEYRLTLLELGV